MEIICLQDQAFYQLVEDVVDRLKEKKNITQDQWISPERAMEILNIKSKTTLQKLRDIKEVLHLHNLKRKSFYMTIIRL